MVQLDLVHASNATIPKALPPGIVAVFIGGTSGIGEATLKLLAKLAERPRIYIVGRAQEAAERIIAECRTANAHGEYFFIQKEIDLMKNVDEVCDEIKGKEKVLNLLFLSAGGPDLSRSLTSEGLHRLYAMHVYGRLLFAIRLLPLLRAANGLSRVISVAAGAHEGSIDSSDFQALKLPISTLRGHSSSMMTLAFEQLAMEAPEVSFVNDHPGLVVTKSLDQIPGILGMVLRTVTWLFGRWMAVPLDESGERHLFESTSEAFAPKKGNAEGIPLVSGLKKNGGTDGQPGSGVYSVKWDNDGPGERALSLLEDYRKDGMREKVWQHITGELDRVERERA